jgi:hypothetical protein
MAQQTLPLFEGLERADEDSLSFTSLFAQESKKFTLKSCEILHKLIRMLESIYRSHPHTDGFICLGFEQFSLIFEIRQKVGQNPIQELPLGRNFRCEQKDNYPREH